MSSYTSLVEVPIELKAQAAAFLSAQALPGSPEEHSLLTAVGAWKRKRVDFLNARITDRGTKRATALWSPGALVAGLIGGRSAKGAVAAGVRAQATIENAEDRRLRLAVNDYAERAAKSIKAHGRLLKQIKDMPDDVSVSLDVKLELLR